MPLYSRNSRPSISSTAVGLPAQLLSSASTNSSITKLARTFMAKIASTSVIILTNQENTLVSRLWSVSTSCQVFDLSCKTFSGTRSKRTFTFRRIVSELRLLIRISNANPDIYVVSDWKDLGWTHIRRFLTGIGPENTSLIKNLGIRFYDARESGNQCMLLCQ